MHTGVSACPQGLVSCGLHVYITDAYRCSACPLWLVSCGLHVYITDAYRCKCMSTGVSKLWFTCVYN